MENQDIFNQFKKAADNAESPGFASMEKVWNRVEEKLDQKVLKKETQLWKKWAVAASILLGVSIGYQFLKEDDPAIKSNEIITEKNIAPKENATHDAVVSAETPHPAIKAEAEEILNTQILEDHKVAWAETATATADYDFTIATDDMRADSINTSAKFKDNVTAVQNSGTFEIIGKADKKMEEKGVEVFANREAQLAKPKKEAPLLVFDNKITNKQSLNAAISEDEVESITELKDPLYIINGIQYTEKELFGPHPTSPYTPLDKQDIETISVLLEEEAVEKYGEKGKKGVVIISTKDGKPKAKNTALELLKKEKK